MSPLFFILTLFIIVAISFVLSFVGEFIRSLIWQPLPSMKKSLSRLFRDAISILPRPLMAIALLVLSALFPPFFFSARQLELNFTPRSTRRFSIVLDLTQFDQLAKLKEFSSKKLNREGSLQAIGDTVEFFVNPWRVMTLSQRWSLQVAANG